MAQRDGDEPVLGRALQLYCDRLTTEPAVARPGRPPSSEHRRGLRGECEACKVKYPCLERKLQIMNWMKVSQAGQAT